MNPSPSKEDQAVAAVVSIARSLETINQTLLTILDELRQKQEPPPMPVRMGLFGSK